MGRYDKYDPKVGGFRAPLAADFEAANREKVYGVGLDSNGRVVIGAGQTGVLGLLVLTKARKAGEIVDVMTSGEIVDFGPTAGVPGTDHGAAGTVYYSAANGVVSSTNADGSLRVGHTVEGQRLVVRCEQTTTAAAVTWEGLLPEGGIPGTDLAAGAVTWADVLPEGGVPITDIAATGTPSASNYLVGDGTWGTVS